MAAAPATPGVLVELRAVGYYGDRGDAMVDESDTLAEDWTGQLCLDWENAALTAADSGIRVAVLRSAPVLDPDGGLLKQLLLPFKLGVGGLLAGGRQFMPWIYRDDDVGLILWALERAEVEGSLNAAAPGAVTNREFSKLSKVLGRPAVMSVPGSRSLRCVAARSSPTRSWEAFASPCRALDLGYTFGFAELERALRDLLRRQPGPLAKERLRDGEFLGRDGAQLGHRLGERHELDPGAVQRRHRPPAPLVGSVDRRDAEPCRQHPVIGGGRATALDVAEHGGARLEPCSPSSISRSSRCPMPPSRTWPNSSVSPSASSIVPSRGTASATTTIENTRPREWRRPISRQTCSISNGCSGIRITSPPPARPE